MAKFADQPSSTETGPRRLQVPRTFVQPHVSELSLEQALGNSATIAGVVRKRSTRSAGTSIMVASFRGMMDFVFKPSLRLARDVTVRTLDDAAEFARTYVGPPVAT